MNVIFVGRKSGRVKQFDLRHPVIMSAAALFVLAILGTAFSIGVGLGARHGSRNPLDQLGNWSAELLHQKAQLEDTKRVLQEKVNALAMRVGQMNANVIRLDALGKRLTRMANLDDGEFDFGHPPAIGGAEIGADGQPGYFRQKLFVYERDTQPCRTCSTPVRQLTQGQRSTYYCPTCQK